MRRRSKLDRGTLVIATLAIASILPTAMASAQEKPARPPLEPGPMVTYNNAWRDFKGSQAFRDPETGMLFYVESDGRHVAAISPDGKVRWVRDPFVEGKLEPYRTDKPQIVAIGKAGAAIDRQWKARFLYVDFNSSQSGVIDMATGEFTFMGQD